MKCSRHTRLTAWLGLLAIWLGVVAPVVTQILPARDAATPLAALCSTHAMRVAPDALHGAASKSFQHGKSCGYCGLLAHHPPLAGGGVAVPRRRSAHGSAMAALALAFQPPATYSFGRPRGPPQAAS